MPRRAEKLPSLKIGSKKFPSSLNRIMNMLSPPLGKRPNSMFKKWLKNKN